MLLNQENKRRREHRAQNRKPVAQQALPRVPRRTNHPLLGASYNRLTRIPWPTKELALPRSDQVVKALNRVPARVRRIRRASRVTVFRIHLRWLLSLLR